MRLLMPILLALVAAAPAADYPVYVRVRYQHAFDEVLRESVASLKLPAPKGIVVGEFNVLRLENGKRLPEELPLFAQFFFGCHYDGEGQYFVPQALYDKLKDKLIQKRQGRLERFFTKAAYERAVAESKKTGRLVLGSDDPDDWQTFIWDAHDEVFRFVETLRIAPKDYKLDDGSKLYIKAETMKRLKTGVIESLLDRYYAQIESFHARKAKEKKGAP